MGKGAEMEQLKPCPFCGGEADLCNTAVQTKSGRKLWSVECTECGVILDRESREDALKVWNNRVN